MDGVGIVLDAAAVVAPCVPGGVSAGIKAARGADKAVDAVKALNKADDVADVGKGLKNADAIREGKEFELLDLATTKSSGADVNDQIRLVLDNGQGNKHGNRTTVDQLIKKDNGHYDIIESKLREGTSNPSCGQKAAKSHVENGNGQFIVRSEKGGFTPGEKIIVDNYYIHYKYKLE